MMEGKTTYSALVFFSSSSLGREEEKKTDGKKARKQRLKFLNVFLIEKLGFRAPHQKSRSSQTWLDTGIGGRKHFFHEVFCVR